MVTSAMVKYSIDLEYRKALVDGVTTMAEAGFINKLKYLRGAGMSGAELGRSLGVPRRTITEWLNSKIVPSESRIRELTPKIDELIAKNNAQGNLKGFIDLDDVEGQQKMLTDDECLELLRSHEVVRDPVHGDIRITALERRLIDSFAMQRLRGVMQLGPTHLVYPGAVHTRFMHALGTLYCAEQLVQTANRNHDVYNQPSIIKIKPYAHILIRLTALLHDVAHIPFGHTLEDEGYLVSPEWEDTRRQELWLGWDSKDSVANLVLGFLKESGFEEVVARRLMDDVRRYIVAKDEDVMKLEFPFVHDLVGNTLCADLLDYLDRDAYFCGLRERSGDRVTSYMAVVSVISSHSPDSDAEFQPCDDEIKGKGRAVLLCYRNEPDHRNPTAQNAKSKPDVISEAIDLLRRRFSLAEKVFFHRTKNSASAMLISAAGSSNFVANFVANDVQRMRDHELIDLLLNKNGPRSKHIMAAYEKRRLYHPIYQINHIIRTEDDLDSQKLWEEIYPKFRDPDERRKIEEELEQAANLAPGSIVIYCPDKDMNTKKFEMLMQHGPTSEIKQLGKVLDENRILEMKAINDRFTSLWHLLVLVDPESVNVREVGNEVVQGLSAHCEFVFGLQNDIKGLRGKGQSTLNQVAFKVIDEWQTQHGTDVPTNVFRELVNADRRPIGMNLVEALKAHLESIMDPDGSPAAE